MTDYIKNKIEAQRKIQAQMEIEHRSQRLLPDVDNHLNKEYVDKMTKEQVRKILIDNNINIPMFCYNFIKQANVQDLRTLSEGLLSFCKQDDIISAIAYMNSFNDYFKKELEIKEAVDE